MINRNESCVNKTCLSSGCSSPVFARGFCNKHYQGKRRDGLLEIRPRRSPETSCLVHNCQRAMSSAGLCKLHYGRLLRSGDPLVLRTRGPKRKSLPYKETSPTKLGKILGVSRQRAHQLLHKDAAIARQTLNKAVLEGKVIKPKRCERCDKATARLDAHHWDYHEALDVRWLCKQCHVYMHTK